VPSGIALPGTGAALDFGLQTAAGTYHIVATNATTTCTNNMFGTVSVTVNPLPTAFTVTGGGTYCSSASGVHVGLSGSTVGVQYQLYDGSVVTGGHAGTGFALDFGLQTTAGTYTVVATNLSTTCVNQMTGSVAVTVIPSVTPAVNILASTSDTICAGTATTFTAMTTNGGSAPVYQWQVNGVNTDTSGTYHYTPVNGDVITVALTSNATCATPPTVTSSGVTMTVLPNITPAVSIAASTGDTICKGTLVTFTASPVGGGTAPVYAWTLNGVNVGSGPYYFNSPSNGDIVICVMTSNYQCRLATNAFSNHLIMTVDSAITPVVSIVANPGTSIGVGQKDSLTAVVSNSITSPTYQWFLNGNMIPGATTAIFVSSNYFNNDSVSCQVTGTGNCGSAVGSASVIIHIQSTGVTTITSASGDIRLLPNPNNGAFTIKGSLGTTDDEEVSFEITDMLGQVVYKDKVIAHNGKLNEQIHLNNTVASGMYLLTLHSGTDNKVFHIVVEQ
jgi:hypothetical protein